MQYVDIFPPIFAMAIKKNARTSSILFSLPSTSPPWDA